MDNEIQFYPKDIQITRQSQIKAAVDYINGRGIILNVRELQRVVDLFVECVMCPQSDELKEKLKKMDEFLDKRAIENKQLNG